MKLFRLALVASMFSLVVLTSCKNDDDPAPASAPTVVADAGADREIPSGETITLDGSGSKDSKGLPLTYLWTVVNKPEDSNPVITTPNIAKPSFATDVDGVYELELTVSSENGTHKDNVVITVEFHPFILSDIKTRTVLEDRTSNPALADYWVNSDIALDAELVIKPGVVIGFAEHAALFVNEEGSISAKGEVDRKIVLKGKANQRGYWRGILVYSNSGANEFQHAEILDAGSSIMVSGIAANITVSDGARLSIKNSRVAGSKGYGIYYMDGSTISGFSSNTIAQNSEAPILMVAGHVAKLDAASSFSDGNGRNVIEVMSSWLWESSEVTWPSFNDSTPYRLIGTVVAQSGLRLSPGVTIEIEENDYFEIGDGYLHAVGTSEKKITFTGINKTESSWKGLIFYSRNANNILEHVVVDYAGNGAIVSGVPASIVLTHACRAKITKTTIRNSGGYGIFIIGADVVINTDVKDANQFVSNAKAPIFFQE